MRKKLPSIGLIIFLLVSLLFTWKIDSNLPDDYNAYLEIITRNASEGMQGTGSISGSTISVKPLQFSETESANRTIVSAVCKIASSGKTILPTERYLAFCYASICIFLSYFLYSISGRFHFMRWRDAILFYIHAQDGSKGNPSILS